MSIAKKIIIGIICLVIFGIAWFFIADITSRQTVTITYNTKDIEGLELYNAKDIRNTVQPTGESLLTIAPDKEFSLKKGLYALKPSGSKTKNDILSLTVGDSPVKKTIDLDYASNYLEKELQVEEAAITQAIYRSNSKIQDLYTINPGNLYHHGEWYGTTLSYKGTDSSSRDTLRLIARKTEDIWTIVTNPPAIILSTLQYPDIPRAILQAVNAIDLGLPIIKD